MGGIPTHPSPTPLRRRSVVRKTWWPVMASALDSRSSGLAGITTLCSWARHLTLIVPLSTQVYKWVLARNNAGGRGVNPAMDWHSIQEGVEIQLQKPG